MNALRIFRVLVTGSRTWTDKAAVYDALDDVLAGHKALAVIHGQCPRGADAMAVSWVMDRWTFQQASVCHEAHPADWHQHGKRAGVLRNAEMVNADADLCLAFIRENSRGATHCARLAEKAGIPVRRFTAGST